jgi:acyl-ACP thioesterase
MDKTGIFEYRTEIYSLDFRRQVTIPSLSNYLLHAATCHADERGFGFDDMSKQNMLWVLSRLVIEISDYQRLSEPIRVYTWIEGVDRIITYRCFEITTMQGETIGHARSSWAGINYDTRRPVSLESLRLMDYKVERPCPVIFDRFDMPADTSEQPVPYKVKYSDLDLNGHFNSCKYMEAIMDLFDIELYRSRSVARFDITYQSEGFYGMDLVLRKAQTAENEYVATITKADGKAICRAKVRFKEN